MNLKIVKTDAGFEVRDNNGVLYGPVVQTEREAHELLNDWIDYFSRAC